jgi:hypothetical protein
LKERFLRVPLHQAQAVNDFVKDQPAPFYWKLVDGMCIIKLLYFIDILDTHLDVDEFSIKFTSKFFLQFDSVRGAKHLINPQPFLPPGTSRAFFSVSFLIS